MKDDYPFGPPRPKPVKPLSVGATTWVSLTVLGGLIWLFTGDWRFAVAGLVLGVAAGLALDGVAARRAGQRDGRDARDGHPGGGPDA